MKNCENIDKDNYKDGCDARIFYSFLKYYKMYAYKDYG